MTKAPTALRDRTPRDSEATRPARSPRRTVTPRPKKLPPAGPLPLSVNRQQRYAERYVDRLPPGMCRRREVREKRPPRTPLEIAILVLAFVPPFCFVSWLWPTARDRVLSIQKERNDENQYYAAKAAVGNERLLADQQEGQDFLMARDDNERKVVGITVFIRLSGPSLEVLEHRVEEVRAQLRYIGARADEGRRNQWRMFQSTLPAMVNVARRWHRTVIPVAGALFAYIRHSPGHTRGFHIGVTDNGHENVMWDPESPELQNRIFLVLGTVNSGKTFFGLMMALQALLKGMWVTVVDRATHFRILARALGPAAEYVVVLDQKKVINAWQVAGVAKGNRLTTLTAMHEAMLVSKPGDTLSTERRTLISDGIRAVLELHDNIFSPLPTWLLDAVGNPFMSARNRLRLIFLECAARSEPEWLTWSVAQGHLGLEEIQEVPLERELAAWLRWAHQFYDEPTMRSEAFKLAIELRPYLSRANGEFRWFLDTPTNIDIFRPALIVIDLSQLEDTPLAAAVSMFTVRGIVDLRIRSQQAQWDRYARVQRQAQSAHENRPSRGMIIFDELWWMLQNADGSAWIAELVLRGRHFGITGIFATQRFSHLKQHPLAQVLLSEVGTTMLYKINETLEEGGHSDEGPLDWIGRRYQLNDYELTRIGQFQTVEGEYAQCMMIMRSRVLGSQVRAIVKVKAPRHEAAIFASNEAGQKQLEAELLKWNDDIFSAAMSLTGQRRRRAKIARWPDDPVQRARLKEAMLARDTSVSDVG